MIDGATRRYRTQWLLLGIGLLTLGAFIGYSRYQDKRQIETRERDRLQGQALIVAENLGRQLQGVNNALIGIRDSMRRWGSRITGPTGSLRLVALRNAIPGVRAIGIFDANGTTVASSQEELIGKNLVSQREFFTVPRAHPDAAVLYVSPPFKSVLGVYSINVVRALLGPGGEFAGIVAATLEPAYFEVVLRSVLYAPGMRAAVIHGDGRIVVEEPGRKDLAGMDLAEPGSRFTQHVESGQAANVFDTGIALANGDLRMSAWRTIRPDTLRMDKPLLVSVNRDMSGIFAPWWRNTYVQGGMFGLVLLIATLSLLYYQRRQMADERRRASYEAERRLAVDALARESHRNMVFLRNASDGVHILDAEGNVLEVSDSFCEMLGHSRAELIGANVSLWDAQWSPQELKRLIAGQMANAVRSVFETRHRRRDGSLLDVEITGQCLELDGKRVLFNSARDITERRRAEVSLRESEQELRTIFEGALDGIVVVHVETRQFLAANAAMCNMLGYTHEEMIRIGVSDIHPTRDLPRVIEQFEKQLRGNTEMAADVPVMRKDGSVFYADIKAAPIRFGGKDCLLGLFRDISERIHAERELIESEARFRGLVEQSIAGTYIIQDGKFAYVNPRFAEIFGYGTAEEMIGRDASSMVAEKDRSTVAENMRQRIMGNVGSVSYEFTGLRRDGSAFDVGVHGARAIHGGRPAVIGLIQDISEKKRAEEKIQRYVAQLETAFMSTVEVATSLSEMRDPYTAGHERRVAEIAVRLGAELGFDARRQEGLRVAGYLHDVGKITIPSEILSKPGRLSAIEVQLIQEHARAGYDVLKGVEFPWPVAQVALQHHERVDGSGYPQGLKGDAILLEARVMSVADVIEAMSSHRPYRPGLGIEQALAEIERGRGTAYDADVADACLRLFREQRFRLPA